MGLVLLRLPLTRIPFGRTFRPRLILPGLTHNPLAASYLILAAPAGHIHTSIPLHQPLVRVPVCLYVSVFNLQHEDISLK